MQAVKINKLSWKPQTRPGLSSGLSGCHVSQWTLTVMLPPPPLPHRRLPALRWHSLVIVVFSPSF